MLLRGGGPSMGRRPEKILKNREKISFLRVLSLFGFPTVA